MSDQQRQRQREQQQQRQRDESRRAPSQPRTAGEVTTQVVDDAKQKKSDVALEDAKVTEGKDGARNLKVQWIDMNLPHAKSCRFAISTAAGNAIEAVMEQKNYRQSYQGTGALQTGIVPAAPHGTPGKLTVRDLATGETYEQPWTWHSGAAGLLSSLWQLLKRLFT
jgi:hypothetical protein